MRFGPLTFGIIGANLKESAETKAVDYIYLTRKLMD